MARALLPCTWAGVCRPLCPLYEPRGELCTAPRDVPRPCPPTVERPGVRVELHGSGLALVPEPARCHTCGSDPNPVQGGRCARCGAEVARR